MKHNIRFFGLIFLCLSVVVSIQAQLPEKGDWKTRVGVKTPGKVQGWVQDVFENPPYNNANADLDSASFLKYYLSFGKLVDNAPYVLYHLYSGAFSEMQAGRKDSTSIYDRMISSQSDPAIKMMIVDDILKLGRNFIDNLDSVNVVRNNRDTLEKAASDSLSRPVAMTKYAHLYYKYAGNPAYYPVHFYNLEQARENFRSAFEVLRVRNVDPGQELEGVYVSEYYRTCEELFKSNEEKYYVQFLEDYSEIVQTCDNLLIPFYDIPDSIKNDTSNLEYKKFQSYNYYTNHNVEGVKALFKASGAATPERLNNYYLERLDEHRNDNEYLSHAIKLLSENACAHTDAFFEYCEASYLIKATYLNCFGCALSRKRYNKRKEMIEYFLQAFKLAKNDLDSTTMAYHIGMALNTKRPVDPSTQKAYPTNSPEYKEWEDNMTTASIHLGNVLKKQDVFRMSRSIQVRQYPADAAYNLALNIYRQINSTRSIVECDKAISYLLQAKIAAPDKYNINADEMIVNIQNTRKQIVKINKDKKEFDKQQRAYEEWRKKQEAEEAFWNAQ